MATDRDKSPFRTSFGKTFLFSSGRIEKKD
jgi:hypothetical protein